MRSIVKLPIRSSIVHHWQRNRKEKQMKQEQNSFSRLWTYLRAYRLEVCLSIFLKSWVSSWGVVEPFVLGLAITELTKISWIWQKALRELVLIPPISRSLWRSIYSVGSSMSWDLIIPTISWLMLFKRPFRTCEMICPIKSITFPFLFWPASVRDLLGRFTSDVETVSNALQQSFLQIVNAIFTLLFVISMVLYLNMQLGLVVILSIPITYFSARFIMKKSQPYF